MARIYYSYHYQKRIGFRYKKSQYLLMHNGLYLCNNGVWDIIDSKRGRVITRLSFLCNHTYRKTCGLHVQPRTRLGHRVGQNSALRTNLPSSSIEYLLHLAAEFTPSPIIHRFIATISRFLSSFSRFFCSRFILEARRFS